MCLGLPMRLITKDGNKGRALYQGAEENVDLSLTPEAATGDFLLVFLGAAREVISEDFARDVEAAHAALLSVMNGGDANAGFADLVNREPELPPHLQAAFEAGRITG